MANFQYGNYCCLIITILLIFCKAITEHTSQGVSIDPRNYWYNVVVALPDKHISTHLCMDLVGFSRATSKEPFSILEDKANGVTAEELKAISGSKVYDERRSFEKLLWGES